MPARPIKPSNGHAESDAAAGMRHLQEALHHLTKAGAGRPCLDRIRAAIRSAGGVVRHARHRDRRMQEAANHG